MDSQNKEVYYRNTFIDSLKGWAICGVVMVHTGASGLPIILEKIVSFGKYGVQIFFVVSAYLTYMSLEKWYSSGRDTGKWLWNKFVRLIPMYYIFLVMYLLIRIPNAQYWLGSLKQVSWLNIVSHLLFLHGLNPYYVNSILGVEWYLGCLAIFLFLVPFLYRKINSIENAFIFFVGSSVFVWYINRIAMLKCPIIDEYIWDAYWGSFNIIVNLPAISFGIFMYFFLNNACLTTH